MRVPTPSPNGTNYARLFMNAPRNPSGAYDAAPAAYSDLITELGTWGVENLTPDLAASLNALINRTMPVESPFADDEDDPFAAVKKLLRDKGMSEADITKAIEIARGGGVAKDTLPGIGGALADRPAEAGLESREADLDRQFGTGRITSEPVRQAADRRTVVDDSDAAMARFAKMFPGAERIGHA